MEFPVWNQYGDTYHSECGDHTVVKGVEDPNPNSTDQVKEWLTSLGWQPCTYKYNKDKETGEEKKVKQVRKNGELTESVKLLIEKNPAVGVLERAAPVDHEVAVAAVDLERVAGEVVPPVGGRAV